MTFWSVARKDLRIHFQDLGAVFVSFVLPVLVITVATYSLSGLYQGQSGKAPRVAVVDEDRSPVSQRVVEGLVGAKGLHMIVRRGDQAGAGPLTVADAEQMIRRGGASSAIVLPRGLATRMAAGAPVSLILMQDPHDPITSRVVHGLLKGLADQLAARTISIQLAAEQVALETGGKANLPALQARAARRAEDLFRAPQVSVQVQEVRQPRPGSRDPFRQTVPGLAVMFVLFNLITVGLSLIREREYGTLRRLQAAPVSRASILLGKFTPFFLVAVVQFAIFFGFGHLVLGMDIGRSPAGIAVVCVAVSVATVSLGLLIASLTRTTDQHTAVSVLVILAMSSLGGSWWPLDIVPPLMRDLAHVVTINAWAIDGFREVLWYGGGVRAVLPASGVILAVGVAAFALAAWRLRLAQESSR